MQNTCSELKVICLVAVKYQYTPSPKYVFLKSYLGTLAPDATGQLNILGKDSDPLRMDGHKIGILEESSDVRLGSLLERQNRAGLEAKVRAEVLGNLPDKPLEWQLAKEKLSGLLILPDLPEGDSSRAVAVHLGFFAWLFRNPPPRKIH